jgi:plastocyanin
MARMWPVVGVALILAPGSVGAASVPVPSVALAGPGGFAAGFATPVVALLQGGSLTFVNADLATHNVTSLVKEPKRIKVGRRYKTIYVPLFKSADIDTGQMGDVVGVARLKPGHYAFICSIHPNMQASLEVQGSP